MRVLVLQGGRSSEAAVSRVSAAGVSSALQSLGMDVVRLEFDRAALVQMLSEPFDVVFPVLHGALGEDGCVQGFCEILGLPYVGSGVRASAVAMHKPSAKRVFREAGLPVLPELVVARGECLQTASKVALERLGTALAVKPSSGGSAIGVELLRDAEPGSLTAALARLLGGTDEVLVEPMVVGRELTCGVLDIARDAEALPPTEIHALSGAFYDYQAKYAAGGSRHECPAPLSSEELRQVQDIARRAHLALGCRDLSRSDVLRDAQGGLWLLETNTMPGFTPTSLFPEAAGVAGIGFAALCERLVRSALERGAGPGEAEVAFPGVS